MHTKICMQIIERHVANHLLQDNVILVWSVVFSKIVSKYGYFLIRAALTTLDVSKIPDVLLFPLANA